MKNTVLMGMSGCGKTTLIQALLHQPLQYAKTQTVERCLHFIDTPGEYMEIRHFYRALIVTAADADEVGLVQDVGRVTSWIPPAFATTFAKPVFGIVTKTDLAANRAAVDQARDALERAGAKTVFEVSAVENDGLSDLWRYLNTNEQTQTTNNTPK